MGLGSKIKKEVRRSPVATAIAATFLGPLGLQLGLLEKESEKRILRPIQEKKQAESELLAAQRELQDIQRRSQYETRLRQQSALKLARAESAKAKRISMAEGIVGEGVGIVNTVPGDGPNLEVNKVPVLDPMDDMGNSIPEV